ncbi:PREDICTED: uncharacterized protein LOC109159764 [Ipomoea nil]|uniref:uncharacterized protein LOC109159764 n=1 Tax=Ipomoea nil TaxID=35883 RepID=UPI000901EEF8|nr:PREDICTED: uncharacterized protein LOC109159764 [Ipomoea nil]
MMESTLSATSAFFIKFANFPLIAALIACLVAQFIKFFIFRYKEGQWNFKRLIGYGGMPSSHSAIATALAAAIALHEGFRGPPFATVLVSACVVMCDGICVRLKAQAEQQAEVVNQNEPGLPTEPLLAVVNQNEPGLPTVPLLAVVNQNEPGLPTEPLLAVVNQNEPGLPTVPLLAVVNQTEPGLPTEPLLAGSTPPSGSTLLHKLLSHTWLEVVFGGLLGIGIAVSIHSTKVLHVYHYCGSDVPQGYCRLPNNTYSY